MKHTFKNYTQSCHTGCYWCGKEWFNWLKAREATMSRVRPNETTSFAEEARTSVRPRQ